MQMMIIQKSELNQVEYRAADEDSFSLQSEKRKKNLPSEENDLFI